MTINRWRALLACALLAASGATVTAQQSDEDDWRYSGYHRPIVRIMQDFVLPATETVREIHVTFGDLTLEGRVQHDVVVILGSVKVTPRAMVGGTLAVIGGSATIEHGASIGHDVVVAGGTLTAPDTFAPDGYQVVVGSPWLGSVLENLTPWITRGLLWGRLIVPGIQWIWPIVGVFFLLYLVLNLVFDRAVGDAATAIGERPLSMFMGGLLVLLLSLPVIAIVAATVIGLIFVPFIVCALIVAGLVGKAAVARAIGRTILRSGDGRTHAAIAVALGLGVLTLAYMVPVIGFVTWALATVIGFGGAATTFRAMIRRERPVPPPAPPAPPSPTVPPGPAHDGELAMPVLPPMTAPSPTQVKPAFSEGLAQYPRATFLDRVAAFALDAILVAIASAILEVNRYEGFFFFLLFAYHVAFWAWRGTTLGGIICSVRVIRTHGADLRFADSVVRGLASVFSLAAAGIGCLWMLQDAESQMWHDKIAGTLVVKVPRELVLA